MLFKSLTCLALMATGTFALPAQGGGYASTCSNCAIENLGADQLLNCDCGNGRGGSAHPYLNLQWCFANVGGFLVYRPNGGWTYTCSNVVLTGTTLSTSCGNGQGGYGYNKVDLNDWVGNSGGELVC